METSKCFLLCFLPLFLGKGQIAGFLFTAESEPNFTEKYTVLIPRLLQDPTFANLSHTWYDKGKPDRPYGGEPFPCQPGNCSVSAKSVHRLRPCDVSVVAALGDSITASFASESSTLLTLFAEYRGVSWSIGGHEDLASCLTLPNILRKYNPNIVGASRKITPPLVPIPWREHLNVAVSGAVSQDLLGQAETLIKRMKRRYQDYFPNNWKVLTIFIGGNDLCALCKNSKHTVEAYLGGIRNALDLLHKEVPKMFVNLVQILDVTRLKALDSVYCRVLHRITCRCATTEGKAWQRKVSMQTLKYQQAVRDLINSGRYDTTDDFTVVIQPFLEGTTIPRLPNGEPDRSYFAPDCFHFSSKAHAAAARALWNNMIEPVGMKRTMWSTKEDYECPRQDFPYFFTRKNSKEYLGSRGLVKSEETGPLADAQDIHKSEPRHFSSLGVVLVCSLVGAIFVLVLVAWIVRQRVKRKKAQDKIYKSEACYHSMK